jgi:stress response protein YsnF/sporulation protein YlmC with PRC-barrel domain
MTTQAEDLLGARMMGTDGKVVGTVEQVFRDDVDGTPAWARVRSGKTGRFVPLAGCQLTSEGLNVPFESQKIMGGPPIDAGQHMSAAQAEELSRYYGTGTTVAAQSQSQSQSQPRNLTVAPQSQPRNRSVPTPTQPRGMTVPAQSQLRKMTADKIADEVSVVRQEERLEVDTETLEVGRVRLRKYVDVEPVEQAVRVFHDEYDIERIPISADEHFGDDLEEGEQEIILHESRPVLHREIVPVERVRLVTRRVEEDQTIASEIRRERIEIEPDEPSTDSDRPGFGMSR